MVPPSRDRHLIPTRLAIAALTAVLVGAGVALAQGAPWQFPAGTTLAALAPLAFILVHRRSTRPLSSHPVAISILSGLGCVTVMVAAQRFGPDREWMVWLALSALIVWMLWQRGQRTPRRRGS